MRLVDKAALWPAACVCGGTDGPLTDTLLEDVDCGRRVYLCVHCSLKVALASDLVPKAELLDVLEKLRKANEQAGVASDENASLVERIAELEHALGREAARANLLAGNTVHLERRIKQFELDPATTPRQQLLAQLAEGAGSRAA